MALTTPEVISLITNNPNTLQQVLDYDHDLVNGIVQIGTNAGGSSPAINQISIGQDALNFSSASSVGIGLNAGKNGSGVKNVIVGWSTGTDSNGNANVIIGAGSGGNTSENNSVIIGNSTSFASIGGDNVHIGDEAGANSGAGVTFGVSRNVFIGSQAGSTNVGANNKGNSNVAIGYLSLFNNDDEIRDSIVAIGEEAGYSVGHALPGGTDSIYIGRESGKNSGGNNTIALGYQAGLNSNSNDLIALGRNAGNGNSISNSFVISNDSLPSYLDYAAASAAITVILGASAGSTYLYHDQTTNSIGAVRIP
jgi:hypothetical protein